MLLGALRAAQADYRAEMRRHADALAGERQRDVRETRADAAQCVELAVEHIAAAPDAAPPADLLAAAALQFAEARFREATEHRTGVLRSGYLRRATRRKQHTQWRFMRLKLRGIMPRWRREARGLAEKRSAVQSCGAVGPKHPSIAGDGADRLFALSTGSGDRAVFMCASPEERDAWVACVKRALEEDARAAARAAALERDAAGPDVVAFEAAAGQAHDRAAFVRALGRDGGAVPASPESFPACSAGFDVSAGADMVPVAWIRYRHGAGPRSPKRVFAKKPPKKAELLPETGNRFLQMRKDMRRDRVSVEGDVVETEGLEAPEEAIAAALAGRLLECARADKGFHLTESGALTHAAHVLVACTRTCSGGDAYACVHALTAPLGDEVVLCPLTNSASPLDIRVRLCKRPLRVQPPPPPAQSPPSFAQKLLASFATSPEHKAPPPPLSDPSTSEVPRDSDTDDSTAEVALAGPRRRRRTPPRLEVTVRATTAYRVCTANPQDEPSDTWALVRGVWSQSFAISGASDRGLRAGEPRVHVGVSDFCFWDPGTN